MGCPSASLSAGAGWRRASSLLLLLLLLVLLLFPRRGASARHKGETCRRWREGHPVPVQTFLCPEESDGADARLCCGACARTYCCSSPEDWLDQRPCFRPGRQGAPTPDGPPAAAHAESYLMLVLVVSLTLSLFLGCSVLVNRGLHRCCGGACKIEEDPPPAMVAAALHPMSCSAETLREAPLDLLVPYTSCEILVPPSSEEDPQRVWDGVPPCPEDPVVQF